MIVNDIGGLSLAAVAPTKVGCGGHGLSFYFYYFLFTFGN